MRHYACQIIYLPSDHGDESDTGLFFLHKDICAEELLLTREILNGPYPQDSDHLALEMPRTFGQPMADRPFVDPRTPRMPCLSLSDPGSGCLS
jgi:hypothetical protein